MVHDTRQRHEAATEPAADADADERRGLAALEARIGRVHLRQRLGLEADYEAHVFRRGTHFFHLENWYSIHALIRVGLTLLGLHGRGRRNVLRIQLRHNPVGLAALPAPFDGYTLLHLSDLHLDLSDRYLESLVERVQGLRYDACVLTGDFRFRTFGPHAPALTALAKLRPHLADPTYAVLGNHDTIRMVPQMEALGIRVLMNESVRLERQGAALYLAGIDDAHYYRTHSFHRAAHDIPADACAVLLSHTPEPYRHAAHAGFSLMLSGHTHGGQICLPGGVPILTDSDAPRAFARGAWRFQGLAGYTSVGCGSSIVDVRLNCLPEVTLHRLNRAGAEPPVNTAGRAGRPGTQGAQAESPAGRTRS
jgi:predicted MPP superfamily phosphohydrolase